MGLEGAEDGEDREASGMGFRGSHLRGGALQSTVSGGETAALTRGPLCPVSQAESLLSFPPP